MTTHHAATRPTEGSLHTAGTPATVAIIEALARILEHAHGRLVEGYSPEVAIVAALAEHRPALALARVARGAWAVALIEGAAAKAHDCSRGERSLRGLS